VGNTIIYQYWIAGREADDALTPSANQDRPALFNVINIMERFFENINLYTTLTKAKILDCGGSIHKDNTPLRALLGHLISVTFFAHSISVDSIF
jgi:hypothetical protein